MNVGNADVIDITRGARNEAKGRWKPVSTPRPGDEPPKSLEELADHIETTFNGHHLTLSDDDTAAAFTLTIGVVRGILTGAQVKGVVDEAQRAELDALMEGLLAAPRLV
jgi:hypothetical protein